MSIDPKFYSPETHDFNLVLGSQCIDRGNPEAGTDPDGSRRDMGALPTYQTHPRVVTTRPMPGEEEVPRETAIVATFDMPMDPASITAENFVVSGQGGGRGGSIAYDPLTQTASFTPDMPFEGGETISVLLTGGISSLWGQTLADFAWSFQITAGTEVVTPEPIGVPEVFALQQNYPNPFNAETQILFSISETGLVTLKVYNMLGQLVKTLLETDLPAGSHQMRWNGVDDSGRPLASGVYFYQLAAGDRSEVKRMVLVR